MSNDATMATLRELKADRALVEATADAAFSDIRLTAGTPDKVFLDVTSGKPVIRASGPDEGAGPSTWEWLYLQGLRRPGDKTVGFPDGEAGMAARIGSPSLLRREQVLYAAK